MRGDLFLEKEPFLVVGLGNPGRDYAHTRHNMGYDVVAFFAKSRRVKWERERKLLGKVAILENGYLFFPTTYMNLSGKAVKRCMDHFKIKRENLLVVSDDVTLPFGSFRMRGKGSAGGHNGLKSIEGALHSQDYFRLKVGVGEEYEGDLSDHVLSSFTREEALALPSIWKEGAAFIERWTESQEESLGSNQKKSLLKQENLKHDDSGRKE